MAEYHPSASEQEAVQGLHLKAAAPGSLLAVLAKHMLDARVSSSLRFVALLWQVLSRPHTKPS